MLHSSAQILNMQLLFGILTSLKTYKNLNLFSVLHAGSVPKDGMMPIVTFCTPRTYPHFLKGEKCVICTRLSLVSLTSQTHPLCTSLAQITSPDTHPLTLLQPQTHTNSFYLSFFFPHAVAVWNT